MTNPETSVGIVGTGRVGQVLARLLRERGQAVVAIAGRCSEHTAAAAAFAGPGVEPAALENLPATAHRILIAVTDEAIGGVAARLTAAGMRQGIALHTCGAHGPELLEPLARAGVSCGVLHPLQTIASPAQGLAALPGSGFLIDGDPAARRWGAEIVSCLNGRQLEISAGQRALYHAAAVLASNCLTALISACATALAHAGMTQEQALQALSPLAQTSLANAVSMGPAQALTGPVRRGDLSTVAAHLEAMRPLPPEVGQVYRVLGLQALALAESQGLTHETARRLEDMLRRDSIPSDD